MPIIPPSRAFKALTVRSIFVLPTVLKNVSAARGASFCHVDRNSAGIQGRAVIAEGYQKWHGAAPIFRSSAIISSSSIVVEYEYHSDTLLKSIAADPRA